MDLLVPEVLNVVSNRRVQHFFAEVRVSEGDATDPLIKLRQHYVIVLVLFLDFVEHGHHRVHEVNPEFLRVQGIPEVVGLSHALYGQVLHFKEAEG